MLFFQELFLFLLILGKENQDKCLLIAYLIKILRRLQGQWIHNKCYLENQKIAQMTRSLDRIKKNLQSKSINTLKMSLSMVIDLAIVNRD